MLSRYDDVERIGQTGDWFTAQMLSKDLLYGDPTRDTGSEAIWDDEVAMEDVDDGADQWVDSQIDQEEEDGWIAEDGRQTAEAA